MKRPQDPGQRLHQHGPIKPMHEKPGLSWLSCAAIGLLLGAAILYMIFAQTELPV